MAKKKVLTKRQVLDQALKDFLYENHPLLKKDKKFKEKETIPDAGHIKYFILCERLSIYTSIGADNVHHASNKATKLFGPMWSQLTPEAYLIRGYSYTSVKDFTLLVRGLAN
jgi:hypothetical protein